MRIHAGRFARRDAEERRVEPIHAIDEPAVARVHLPWRFRVGVEILIDVPPLRGDFAHGVAAVPQILPEPFRRIGAAGEPARHADDGDGATGAAVRGIQLGLEIEDEERKLPLRQALQALQHAHRIGPRVADSITSTSSSERDSSAAMASASPEPAALAAAGAGADGTGTAAPKHSSSMCAASAVIVG